jgi:hypothetical protein
MLESDRYNRNELKKGGSSVEDEVQKLLKKSDKKITSQDFMRLRSQYKDEDLVNKIQNAYVEKQGSITKRAKKFANLIRQKYSSSQTPFHMLLDKAYKYKIKYSLSDAEFAEFQRIFEQELVGLKSNDVVLPATNLMKVLGGVTLDYHGFAGKLNDTDFKYLQEIMKLHASSRSLHAQVLLQSMQYRDCDIEALTGAYNRDLHNVGEHIHPVVAALFLPKFPIVENFFLFSNIAGIVKCRYNGEPLASRPDYELFYALTTDPNDVVCDNRSPVLDLLNRAQLQTQLWNSVLHLRNGQYYNNSFKDFIGSVDMCRLNKQDSPDLVYGRFDGVILKRLLSAFSFRPTVVATTPSLINTVSINPYLMNIRPQVTSVPMINMRIPPKITDDSPLDLENALEQNQLFLEGGAIVPKNTSLIWSRNIVVFYVDRRAHSIKYNDQMNAFSMNSLPAPIAGLERLNDRVVNFNTSMMIKEELYELRSIVFSELNILNQKPQNLVIGTSAIVRIPGSIHQASVEEFYCYDPYGPVVSKHSATGAHTRPVTGVFWEHELDDLNVLKTGQTRGSIFIYASSNDGTEAKDLSM